MHAGELADLKGHVVANALLFVITHFHFDMNLL